MILRERCPNCGGNLSLERDNGRWYGNCLLCAREKELRDTEIPPELKAQLPRFEMREYNNQSPSQGKVTQFDTIPFFAHHVFNKQWTK